MILLLCQQGGLQVVRVRVLPLPHSVQLSVLLPSVLRSVQEASHSARQWELTGLVVLAQAVFPTTLFRGGLHSVLSSQFLPPSRESHQLLSSP